MVRYELTSYLLASRTMASVRASFREAEGLVVIGVLRSGDRVVFGAIDTEKIAHQSVTCKKPVVRGLTISWCIHLIFPARFLEDEGHVQGKATRTWLSWLSRSWCGESFERCQELILVAVRNSELEFSPASVSSLSTSRHLRLWFFCFSTTSLTGTCGLMYHHQVDEISGRDWKTSSKCRGALFVWRNHRSTL